MNRAILRISPEWLAEMLKSVEEGTTRRYDVVENGLPPDARVVEVVTVGKGMAATIFIHLESVAFPKTEEGSEPTMLEHPVFRVYYDEEPVAL